jgi:hypothetical protein
MTSDYFDMRTGKSGDFASTYAKTVVNDAISLMMETN